MVCERLKTDGRSTPKLTFQALVQTAVQFADANCAIFEPELGEHKLVCARQDFLNLANLGVFWSLKKGRCSAKTHTRTHLLPTL